MQSRHLASCSLPPSCITPGVVVTHAASLPFTEAGR
jgi:hypothetical protein